MKVVRNPRVKFLPESINGTARELDWLRNMGDWMISKKRFWGLALPIWVDEHDPTQFEVIGSHEELKERAVEGWEEFDGHTPHRPFVDRVKIRNPRTGNLMSRIPDVGNPWLDAGIVAFSTLKYNTDRDYWRKWYPADFITESFPGQFRNWFYALLAHVHDDERRRAAVQNAARLRPRCATSTATRCTRAPGTRSSSSRRPTRAATSRTRRGNAIPFKAIGADVMRWLYCRHNPAANLNFGPEPANEVRSKFLFKLWNCYAFFCNYAAGDGFDPAAPQVPVADRPDIDRWMLSDLQLLIGDGPRRRSRGTT